MTSPFSILAALLALWLIAVIAAFLRLLSLPRGKRGGGDGIEHIPEDWR